MAGQCALPRPAGTLNPETGLPYGDRQGSLTTEKAWIRALVNETYLWYREVVPRDPALYTVGAVVPYVNPADNSQALTLLRTNSEVLDAYFNSQRSMQRTASGLPKDRFHFTAPTAEWQGMSDSGVSVGFGFHVALLATDPPRNVQVAYTDPATPAANNQLRRGARFLKVNGVDIVNGIAVDAINEALFTPVPGKQYVFEVQDAGAAAPRQISMSAGTVTAVPVQNVRTLPAPHGMVGYLQFNDHIATAEAQLITAIEQLKQANNGAGISDLVLDLRYNGGGLLDIASELAGMIAGSTATAGKTFEKLIFNDKNPFLMSEAEANLPFAQTSLGFSGAPGLPLPQLGLTRLFVLTGPGTCSASEAIINGLRGIGVEVIQIGQTTCGKPYGFRAEDNCGTSYFTIQFQGLNHQGFGDYGDGFRPGGTGTPANHLPGCVVTDDLSRALGDPGEPLLAAALHYRSNGVCPGGATTAAARPGNGASVLRRSPMRMNRIFQPARTGALR